VRLTAFVGTRIGDPGPSVYKIKMNPRVAPAFGCIALAKPALVSDAATYEN
jgi:hypothetical protein